MVKNQMRNSNLSVIQHKDGNTNAIATVLEYNTMEEDLLDSKLTPVVDNTINTDQEIYDREIDKRGLSIEIEFDKDIDLETCKGSILHVII